MYYIYHAVPEKLIGNALVPLNKMQDLDISLQEKYLQKYKGRESILDRKVPLLDCFWNDVVQFLPFHPGKIFELQVELGLIPAIPNYKYFKIDLKLLNPTKTVVFFKNAAGDENVEVKYLVDVEFESLQTIPDATRDYFKSLVGDYELPFNYQFVPHILYLGTVDVSEQIVISL